MRKILVFFIIFCFQLGNAKVGDVYYCIEKYKRGIENFADGPIEKNYILEKFSFKREENRIIFNKNYNNTWANYIMDYVINSPYSEEYFDAFDEKEDTGSILRYNDGEFVYTANWRMIATYTFAECTTY